MREKKYTRTIAVRVTEYEYQLIMDDVAALGCKSPSVWLRNAIQPRLVDAANLRQAAAKKAEAAAKRAATKAAKQAQA